MPILRKVQCDSCGKEEYEKGVGTGWNSWINILGIEFNGIINPFFCPVCTQHIMNFIEDELPLKR